MFIEAGASVYPGMVIGEHTRGNDLEVNPLKAKQLTNMRASGKDEAVRLTPPRIMTPSAPDSASICLASATVLTSPLPITGIDTARLTSPMNFQSARPL